MSIPKSTLRSTGNKFSIHPALPLVWGFLAFCGKGDGVLFVFAAAVIHEVAHIAVFLSYGERIKKLRLMPFGISVSLCSATDVSCGKEVFASLAGIIANIAAGIVSLLFGGVENLVGLDFFAACNFAFAAVNMIPVIPLDGGRALYFLLLKSTSPARAQQATTAVSLVFLVPLTAASFFLIIKTGYNFSLLLICIYLFSYIALKREI